MQKIAKHKIKMASPYMSTQTSAKEPIGNYSQLMSWETTHRLRGKSKFKTLNITTVNHNYRQNYALDS